MDKNSKKYLIFGTLVCLVVIISLIILNFMSDDEVTPTIYSDSSFISSDTYLDSTTDTETFMSEKTFLIDLNTAKKEDFMELKGIGQVTADAIIEYRTENLYFYSVEELLNVTGIGEKTYEDIKDYVVVYPENMPKKTTVIDITIPEITETSNLTTTTTKPPVTEPPITKVTTTITTTTVTTESSLNVKYPLDINTCSVEELETLSGIGPVIAQRIIYYRTEVSPFYSIEEIKNVKGIGDAIFNKIFGFIYVDTTYLPKRTTIDTTTPVYTVKETTIKTNTTQTTTLPPQPVNLNTATFEDLMKIPNMTDDIAQKIIGLRNSISYFSSIEELLYIDGVSSNFIVSIKPYIYVE